MKINKCIIVVIIALLVLGSVGYAIGRIGMGGISTAITEARCQAGAFVAHSEKVERADDGDGEAAQRSDEETATKTNTSGRTPRLTKATGSNLISNGDVESGQPQADNWLTNVYGENDAHFIEVEGHNSGRALQVGITKYTKGDANWYYPMVNVTPGQYYEYRDFYRSNVATRPMLMLRHTDGHDEYITLRTAQPARNWTSYSARFFIPDDVQQALVYHPLGDVGVLVTDDYALEQVQPGGFREPLVSITFDDGWKSIHDNALPILERYGFDSTQYLVSGYIGQAKSYVTPKDVYDLRRDGHEIASHTVDHIDLTKQPASGVAHQLLLSKQNLSKCFATPTSFAPPYGTFSRESTKQASELYQTVRSTDAGFNTVDNLDSGHILVQNMTPETTPAQLKSWLKTAANNHAWLVLVYHQIEQSPGGYTRTPTKFDNDLRLIKASHIPVKTVHDAYAEVASQKN